MSMWTLENLGNLGEFVGAIGVVISLAYLARQMQQNTLSMRAASFNSMVENSLRLLEHVFRDPEFAAFLAKAEQDPSKLTPAERVRWDSYMTAVYRHFGNLLYQRRVGVLEEGMWQSYERTLREHLRQPAWVAWYRANELLFSTPLTHLIDEILRTLETEGERVPSRRATDGATSTPLARRT